MPTENRSSNTEMVSVPPYIGLEPLVGRYYPAQCRRCGWVGSSEELTEDDAQCTRDVGDSLCLGDCDELERHDLLNIIQAMAAPQPHPDPIAWMVGTAFWWTKEEAERDAAETGKPLVPFGPIADTGEIERLRTALKFYADREHYHFESGDWDTVSGEPLNILWHGEEPDFIEDGSVARATLELKPILTA